MAQSTMTFSSGDLEPQHAALGVTPDGDNDEGNVEEKRVRVRERERKEDMRVVYLPDSEEGCLMVVRVSGEKEEKVKERLTKQL